MKRRKLNEVVANFLTLRSLSFQLAAFIGARRPALPAHKCSQVFPFDRRALKRRCYTQSPRGSGSVVRDSFGSPLAGLRGSLLRNGLHSWRARAAALGLSHVSLAFCAGGWAGPGLCEAVPAEPIRRTKAREAIGRVDLEARGPAGGY